MSRTGRAAALSLIVFGSTAAVLGQGTITSGDARFEFNNTPTPGAADLQTDGLTSRDHLFQDWWWYRVEGVETRESRFPWFPTVQSYNGNVATIDWVGLGGGRFSARLVVTLADGAIVGQGSVVEQMTITNAGNSPLNIVLFKYTDFDVAGTSANDVAGLAESGAMWVRDTMLGDTTRLVDDSGGDYEVDAFSGLRTALDDTDADDLTSSGLPFGPGDFTAALQWNRSIAAHATDSVQVQLLVNVDPCLGRMRGDANCDGTVNNFDIAYFVLGVVEDRNGYLAVGGDPTCYDFRDCWGDLNGVGGFDNFDIDFYVNCLTNLPPPGQPCP